jgi:hypothetical protein
MKGRTQAFRQMQDLEDVTAEISSAVRARMVSVQDTQDLFASLNLNVESGQNSYQPFSAMPSSELRRNVTRRRSNERVRDSVGSTSVPITSLVSSKPKERQKDMVYASETKAAIKKEKEASKVASVLSPVSVWSPAITRRLIPREEDDPIRHRL